LCFLFFVINILSFFFFFGCCCFLDVAGGIVGGGGGGGGSPIVVSSGRGLCSRYRFYSGSFQICANKYLKKLFLFYFLTTKTSCQVIVNHKTPDKKT